MNSNLPRAIIVTVVAFLAGASTFPGDAAPVSGASGLWFGVTANSPPLIIKQGNDIVGLEADFARALGREVQFVEVPWEDLIDALEENKIDIIMLSMSIPRARQFRVAFSDPYFRISQMALVRAADRYRFAPRALKKGSLERFIDDSTMIWCPAGTLEAGGLVVAPMTVSDELLAWGVRGLTPSYWPS